MNRPRVQGRMATRSATAGMALVAVLWITAALSLMLTGMTRSVREEVRAATGLRQSIEGRALAEAGINLVLQGLAVRPEAVTRLTTVDVTFKGVPIQVQIMPMSGLVDVNGASAELLQSLFVVAAGLPPAAALSGAQAVVQWRTRRDSAGRSFQMDAPEDLMLVPDFPYDVYARIAPLVTAGRDTSGRVNPLAAPDGVLMVLAKGNVQVAARVAAARNANAVGIDLTQLEAAFVGSTSSRAYRLAANIPLADGARMQFMQDVNFRADAQSELPWRILQTQANVVLPPDAN